jgi:CHASE2 domain-containing sensor protein
MARGRKTRRIPDWMIVLAITCVVLGRARVRRAFLQSIEHQTFDLRLQWFGSRAPALNIAIVTIDEESMGRGAMGIV